MKLIGKHGEITFINDKGIAVIKSPILQNKYGEQVTFGPEDLAKWIKRLKIYSTSDGRIQLRSDK